MVLAEDGCVLTFGRGMYGRLGHGDEQNQLVPKVVDALQGVRVCQVAAGESHSMVLTADGQVLAFGLGRYGRLGHENEEDQLVPKVVGALQGVQMA